VKSKKEDRDFTVTMNSVDEYSFDLDLNGEPYAGGSYLIPKVKKKYTELELKKVKK
jgi:hypothetical protein